MAVTSSNELSFLPDVYTEGGIDYVPWGVCSRDFTQAFLIRYHREEKHPILNRKIQMIERRFLFKDSSGRIRARKFKLYDKNALNQLVAARQQRSGWPTVREAAARIHRSLGTIVDLINSGAIEAHKEIRPVEMKRCKPGDFERSSFTRFSKVTVVNPAHLNRPDAGMISIEEAAKESGIPRSACLALLEERYQLKPGYDCGNKFRELRLITRNQYEQLVRDYADARMGRKQCQDGSYLSPIAAAKEFKLGNWREGTLIQRIRHHLGKHAYREIRSHYFGGKKVLTRGPMWHDEDLARAFDRRKPLRPIKSVDSQPQANNSMQVSNPFRVIRALGIHVDFKKRTIERDGKRLELGRKEVEWHIFTVALDAYPEAYTLENLKAHYPGDKSKPARTQAKRRLNTVIGGVGLTISQQNRLGDIPGYVRVTPPPRIG